MPAAFKHASATNSSPVRGIAIRHRAPSGINCLASERG